MDYVIDGIKISVTKKRIKNYNLSVKKEDGSVCMSAPQNATKERILSEIKKFLPWIKRTREKILAAVALREQKEENGIMLFGTLFKARYEIAGRSRVEKREDEIIVCTKTGEKQEIDRALFAFYKKELILYLAKRLPELERLTGLYSSGFSVNGAKTRWGSCNHKTKKLNFSARLALKKFYLIDSVVIHELCHIAVPNHQSAFYELIEGFLPDYRKLKKELEHY